MQLPKSLGGGGQKKKHAMIVKGNLMTASLVPEGEIWDPVRSRGVVECRASGEGEKSDNESTGDLLPTRDEKFNFSKRALRSYNSDNYSRYMQIFLNNK